MKRFRVFLVVMVLSAYCVVPSVIYSCGPVFPTAVFTFKYTPDFPLAEFLEGKLGVVHPGLKQSYLMVAYRYLSAQPLNGEEKSVLYAFWKRQHPDYSERNMSTAARQWLQARNAIANNKTDIDVYRNTDYFSSYENCQADAFVTASRTLQERVKQFGKDSEPVRHWLSAQDVVFSDCKDGDRVPTEAEPQDPPIIRADRAYQVAAAHFYSGELDTAAKEFEGIAADKTSPWNGIARYLEARALVRKASLLEDVPEAKPGDEWLEAAAAILKKVLADPELSAWHEPAQERLNMINARLHPEERLRELAAQVSKANHGPLLRQEVNDFFYLLDRNKEFSETDMTDWIDTMRRMNVASAGHEAANTAIQHAIGQWHETHSLPWLVAAMNVTSMEKDTQIIREIEAVQITSPAYLSAAYFRVKSGDVALWKTVTAMSEVELPPSARNRFLEVGVEHPQTLDEFLATAARKPATEDLYQEDEGLFFDADNRTPEKQEAPMFDAETAEIFNRSLPLSVLKETALKNVLPEQARSEVLKAAWTRAFLAKDWKTTDNLQEAMNKSFPVATQLLKNFAVESDSEKKYFLGAVAILQMPGLMPMVRVGVPREEKIEQLSEFRDNWWCGRDDNDKSSVDTPKSEPPDVKFLTLEQKKEAAEEWKALSETDDGKVQLSEIVVAHQKKHPEDPLLPEALDLSLRALRYGCGVAPKGFTHHVFNVLHKNYPKSAAAKRNRPWGEW